MNKGALEPHSPRCRLCGSSLKHIFVDLGTAPLSNAFLSADQPDQEEPFYPLCVRICERCLLVQLPEFASPNRIFCDYAYFSSYSDTWLQHSSAFADMIVQRLHLDGQSQIVEIASNDGYLLQYFLAKGLPVLGIEPAANVAEVANNNGIPTLVEFFGRKTALELADKGQKADLLIGNNVLAHVPDLHDFITGMKILLKRSGLITMEFPHLMRLMAENQFDTIYHEHFSYFSFITAEMVFARHGLTLFDVEEIPTHGGSLRIYARHTEDASKPVTERIRNLRAKEQAAGFTRLDYYLSFKKRINDVKHELVDFLRMAKAEGKSIAGYGAPAKGNTLLNYCGIRSDIVGYTVDRSHYKQGKFLPGSRIPIYPPQKILETKPDYLLILPWNLKEEIMMQMAQIRDWGGQFVLPIPEVRVL